MTTTYTTTSITMKHRTAAVVFLSAISMLGVFVWWGRLPKNTTSAVRERHEQNRSPNMNDIIDNQQETPPPFLFTSDWTNDNNDDEDDENENQSGERIRGKVIKKKNTTNNNNKSNNIKKKAKQELTASAKSIDVSSLETTSDVVNNNISSSSKSNPPSSSSSSSGPKMVWLMSYPNSGTSYTMMMVGRASQKATASNYGREVAESGVINTPLYPDQFDGPFYRPNPKKPLPKDYILVKTHCGGRCVTCGPEKYVLNEAEFLDECRRGSGFFGHSSSSSDSKGNAKRKLQDDKEEDVVGITDNEDEEEEDYLMSSGDGDRIEVEGSDSETTDGGDDDDDDESNGFHTVHYDANLVKKAIHLYRNPFHNVVSRFHLERKHWVESKKQFEVNRYPNNSTGFQRWCKDLNKFYGPTAVSSSSTSKTNKSKSKSINKSSQQQHYLPPEIVELMQRVPCHGEMYKYIQWHNMAYNVTAHSNKPTLILHYENYDKRWNQTVTKILDFLHLDFVGVRLPFTARHDYDPYFSNNQRRATKALLQRLASAPVWQQVERYFD